KFSLIEALKSALGIGSASHKTLVDQFAYPHGGTGSIYERMAKLCEERGNRIHLNTPVQRILIAAGRAVGIELADGTVKHFDRIVSCMPITQLVSRMDSTPAPVLQALDKLRFRNTILVYLQVDCAELFKDNWLYVHSTELQTGRISNFRNWVPQLYGDRTETIVALEYWCYTEDDLWRKPDAELIALAADELKRAGLLKDHAVLDGHVVRMENSYPVYAKGYKIPLATVAEYLNTINDLCVIGRYGAFKYNNQDHSILMGYLAAQNLSQGTSHDLWAINTDYDYQEASKITEVGLVELAD
ncbi:MAG: FAD-dependent oxidoreductase, partial [Kiritimatiellae bacterium]|nr:FAD-dependent oxidoreductase [Kiritimatiellia bacterium]